MTITLSDLPSTQFTAGKIAKDQGVSIKEAHEALAPFVDRGDVVKKTAKSGAVNYSLTKNAKNAKAAGTADRHLKSVPVPEAKNGAEGQDQYAAAKREKKALDEWTKNGEKGKRPETPNYDAIAAAHAAAGGRTKARKTTGRKSSGKSSENSTPRGTTVRFVIDGKPMPDSQNKLSSVAWYHTAGVCGDDSPRCSVSELRKILADVKIADPSNTVGWTVELSNGKVVSTEAL